MSAKSQKKGSLVSKASGLLKLLVIIAVAFGCAEAIARVVNVNPKDEYLYSSSPVDDDPALAYKNRRNARIRLVRKFDGKLISDSSYTTDEYGRRTVPGAHRSASRRSILFFGCSFTFGEGVNDDQTMPFYVAEASSTYRVYNYGVSGYGPQQMLVQLENPELPDQVENKDEAIAVYTFIDHHIQRVIGSMELMSYAARFPYYRMDDRNELVRTGTFQSGRPFLTELDVWLGKSSLVQFLRRRLGFPKTTEEDVRLTAKIIEESRNAFMQRFHSQRFYVLIYPRVGGPFVPRLLAYLNKAGIKYFDYSPATGAAMADTLPHDSHPSARSYRAVAMRLARDLGVAG